MGGGRHFFGEAQTALEQAYTATASTLLKQCEDGRYAFFIGHDAQCVQCLGKNFGVAYTVNNGCALPKFAIRGNCNSALSSNRDMQLTCLDCFARQGSFSLSVPAGEKDVRPSCSAGPPSINSYGGTWLAAKHDGQLLSVDGGSRENGAGIIQWPSDGSNHQKWKLDNVKACARKRAQGGLLSLG